MGEFWKVRAPEQLSLTAPSGSLEDEVVEGH